MQTFLISNDPTFMETFRCLDNKRLGKQRVEALQIVNALTGRSKGWRNHPATRMWAGSVIVLKYYHDQCISAWIDRGFRNNMPFYFDSDVSPHLHEYPKWFTNPAVFASHRSNLLRKDPLHYSQFGWTESPDLPYVWPSQGD